MTKSYVRLEVPHLRQGKNLCVPTSAAMVLKYFGEIADPVQLKAMAEGDKPATRRNADFTYWDDMSHALAQMGYSGTIKTYPRTRQGFETGIRQIRRHLKKGWPVLIDVHQDVGHTFVATGYDDVQQALYVCDPNLPASQSRVLSFSVLLENWHNHRLRPDRSAFFAYPGR